MNAYRIAVSGWMVLLAGIIVAVLADLTQSVQAIKTSVVNLVKSLRTE